MTAAPRLRLAGIRKSYTLGPETIEVLRGVTFETAAASSLSITGPSGSGKSTLLHIIGTLDRPTGGTVTIDGRDPHQLPERELAAFRNRAIGFVFQDHHLLPQYSLIENVMIPAFAGPGGPGTPAAAARARALLERVGLGHRLGHHPPEVSGGERQRAAVARALMNRPGILLADEPTGNLDHAAATTVVEMLFDLHRQEETILIVVTHSAELASRCARRLRLSEGLCFED